MRPIGYNHKSDKRQISPYLPDFYAESIFDIDFELLHQLGIRHVLLDLDQTLRQAYSRKLENDVIDFFAQLQQKRLFESINIVSNNSRNLRRYAEPIGAAIFQPFWHKKRFVRKPSKLFYDRVLKKLNVNPKSAVMIGDKIRNDVFGANRAGVLSVLVNPFGRDYWFDQILLARLRDKRSFQSALQSKSQHSRSTPDYIKQALYSLDIKPDTVKPAGNKRIKRDSFIAQAGRKQYWVTLIGSKKTIKDWIRQAKDRILKLGRYDATAYLNPRHRAELQAFISKEAASAGVQTPDIAGVIDVGDYRYGVVQAYLEGKTLSQIASNDLTMATQKSIWQEVSKLHNAAIAHRDLTAENIILDNKNRPYITSFRHSILAASESSIAQDIAQLLSVFALKAGVQSTATVAKKSLDSATIDSCITYLRPKFLSPETKQQVRRKPNLLKALKRELLSEKH